MQLYKWSKEQESVNKDVKGAFDQKAINATADFSIKLFLECAGVKKNMMVSPASILTAMSMTANGAANNTLAQMKKVMYQSEDISQSCYGLSEWMQKMREKSKNSFLSANSIWIREGEDIFTKECKVYEFC